MIFYNSKKKLLFLCFRTGDLNAKQKRASSKMQDVLSAVPDKGKAINMLFFTNTAITSILHCNSYFYYD